MVFLKDIVSFLFEHALTMRHKFAGIRSQGFHSIRFQERDGELLAESEEFTYECGVRQKYPILFDEPIPLQVFEIEPLFCAQLSLDFY